MKINRMDHICIAVKNLDEARKTWEPLLGKEKPDDTYVDEPEKIRVARYWITPDGDVAKFIESRGEGVMLISFNVDNTREAVKELQGKGYPFIPDNRGEIARPFRSCEFAFVHPKKLNGVLTEIIDDKSQ